MNRFDIWDWQKPWGKQLVKIFGFLFGVLGIIYFLLTNF